MLTRSATVSRSCVPLPEPAATASQAGPRRISILGATGSIGESTLDIVRRNRDDYKVVALTANGNTEALARLAIEFDAEFAALGDADKYSELHAVLEGTSIQYGAGEEALDEAASINVDWTMAAIVGIAGLRPTIAAMNATNTIALANKECLVSAGSVFTRAMQDTCTTLIPVDSEHSAAFQAIDASGAENIETITLTASGGPFREWDAARIASATRAEALAHPKWSMGPKISIDSATLMNKGLEVIEAWHLFPVEPNQIDVVVHPQSTIHCLVSYRDGSVLAHLGAPDMRTPISFSLAWPRRMEVPVPRLNFAELGRLDFEPPDPERFPCLALARAALERGEAACTVLNAANEVAVQHFLDGGLTIDGIARVVEATLEAAEKNGTIATLNGIASVYAIDTQARAMAQALL